jgi:hypothetical protein
MRAADRYETSDGGQSIRPAGPSGDPVARLLWLATAEGGGWVSTAEQQDARFVEWAKAAAAAGHRVQEIPGTRGPAGLTA